MKNDEEVKDLHCFPFAGGSIGGRPKLPIDAEIKSVFGRVVFSLPHACLAAGLIGKDLSNGQMLNGKLLAELSCQKWDNSVERFFDDLKIIGLDRDRLFKRETAFRGALIGWTFTFKSPDNVALKIWRVCSELDLTILMLSKRVGDIFISSREPDLSWDSLFGSYFGIDEDINSASDLLSDPWNRYKWW